MVRGGVFPEVGHGAVYSTVCWSGRPQGFHRGGARACPVEPTDLPDGTELELLALDPGDWLDEADRAALHKALRESDADVAAGRLIDADEILKELRSR